MGGTIQRPARFTIAWVAATVIAASAAVVDALPDRAVESFAGVAGLPGAKGDKGGPVALSE